MAAAIVVRIVVRTVKRMFGNIAHVSGGETVPSLGALGP